MPKTVLALYDDIADAVRVVEEVMDLGLDCNAINIVTTDPENEYSRELERIQVNKSDTVSADTRSGAVSGGLIGGLAGALFSMSALVVPGIGPVLLAGPIAYGLAGAGAGAAGGGIIGRIAGKEISDKEADTYAEAVRRGATLVAVASPGDLVERVTVIMERKGPVDLKRRSEAWQAEGWTGYDAQKAAFNREEAESERARYRSEPKGRPAVVSGTPFKKAESSEECVVTLKGKAKADAAQKETEES